jgi:nucleoside-diphosphate-sugar epimerase
VYAYGKSKTLAERAAWDWIESEGGNMELAVINPVGVFGPVLGKDFATSVVAISRLMNGEMPGLPNLGFNIVDVRDVADLHLRAMTDPKANGERFLAVADNGFMWMKDMAMTLRNQLGEKAKNVPTRTVPNFVIRIVGLWDPAVKLITPELSKVKNCSNEKAKTVLGWKPRSIQDAIVSAGESLYEFGVVKK